MARILLVEDNDNNRDMLSRRLTRKGYEVALARHGLECLEMVQAERPDLILMDMSLPHLDGWEVTRRLRAQEATARIPIIAVTAHALEDDRLRALQAGCDDYDTKPINFDSLLTKMEALLRRS